MGLKFVLLFFLGPLLFVHVNGNDVTDRGRRVVCYYFGVNQYIDDNLIPEDIDPSLCTHLIYLNAKVSNETDEMLPKFPMLALYDNGGLGIYNRTAMLKRRNPQLKVLLRVFPKCCRVQLPTTSETRSRFIASAVEILQTHGLDGLDMDLYRPFPQDKIHFTLLLSELRSEFDKHGFLISTYFPDSNFDVYEESYLNEITRYCDFVMVMTLDYSGPRHNFTKFYSPLTDVKSTIDTYLAINVPPEKMLITIPAIGTISQLRDVNNTKLGAATTTLDNEKSDIAFSNIMPYGQMLKRFTNQSENWTVHRDEISYAPYAVNKNGHWVSYDDTVSVGAKVRYIIENKLGGAVIMALDMDDFRGIGGKGKYPLTRALSDIILKGEENHS